VSERSERISKLLKSHAARTSYIKAKLSVLIAAQIKTLRVKSVDPPMPYQRDLANESDLHQSRISMFETPGEANMTIETLAKIAAALKVGVVIKFVPFSDMVRWESSFSADIFDVKRLRDDEAFLNPEAETRVEDSKRLGGLKAVTQNNVGVMRVGIPSEYVQSADRPLQAAIGGSR
jgi:transcriptional regulator with XRE-family HTH domain